MYRGGLVSSLTFERGIDFNHWRALMIQSINTSVFVGATLVVLVWSVLLPSCDGED